MFYYSEEDVDRSFKILRDLVKENENLKKENTEMKRFFMAACLSSKEANVSFNSSGFHSEDLDVMYKYCLLNLSTNYDLGCTIGGIPQPCSAYISIPKGTITTAHIRTTQEELLEKFEKTRYKE